MRGARPSARARAHALPTHELQKTKERVDGLRDLLLQARRPRGRGSRGGCAAWRGRAAGGAGAAGGGGEMAAAAIARDF